MIKKIIEIARKAGKITLKARKKGLETSTKKDKFDFITSADTKSEEYILKRLKEEFPNDEILAEETQHSTKIHKNRVWMIDPLDGTKDFKNNGEGFSVMIGLYDKGKPILGVVYAPAKDLLYYAEKNKGAYMIEKNGPTQKLQVRNMDNLTDSRMVTRFIQGESRPGDQLIDHFDVEEKIPESSIGIKLGLIARGNAEIHINTNFRAHKWDVCAPQIILEEAGGKLTDLDGREINYESETNKLLNSFVATNKLLHNKVVEKIQDFYSSHEKKF